MALILLAAVPVAEAQRACADVLGRCQVACDQRFGGNPFSGVLVSSCGMGCSIGYVYCASSY